MSGEGFEDEAPIRRRKLAGQSRHASGGTVPRSEPLSDRSLSQAPGFCAPTSAHQCAAPGSSGCDQSWRRRCSSAEPRPQPLVTVTRRRASEYSVWQTRGNLALPALRQRLCARLLRWVPHRTWSRPLCNLRTSLRSRSRQPRLVTIRAWQTTRNAIWLHIQTASIVH